MIITSTNDNMWNSELKALNFGQAQRMWQGWPHLWMPKSVLSSVIGGPVMFISYLIFFFEDGLTV